MPLQYEAVPAAMIAPAGGLAGRLAAFGAAPEALTRSSMRKLCQQWLQRERDDRADAVFARQRAWMEGLRTSTLAVAPSPAPSYQQEMPLDFFRLSLGRQLKYSCCHWDEGIDSLGAAEDSMLCLYAERGEIRGGQRILELGAGWGSFTLFLAQRFHNVQIVAVTNSPVQRDHIEARCHERALFNVEVVLGDTMRLNLAPGSFDRVFAVEMFEHLHDYRRLMQRIATWLAPQGKLFVQMFCHDRLLHLFEQHDDSPWMGRHFFSGGLMPSADTLPQVQDELKMEQRWLLSGTHYERTANAWLQNLADNKAEIVRVLQRTHGPAEAHAWYQRWRLFWMACAELFGYGGGNEWKVAHYRFAR